MFGFPTRNSQRIRKFEEEGKSKGKYAQHKPQVEILLARKRKINKSVVSWRAVAVFCFY